MFSARRGMNVKNTSSALQMIFGCSLVGMQLCFGLTVFRLYSGSGMAAVWRFRHHHLASQGRHQIISQRERKREREKDTQAMNVICADQLHLVNYGVSSWQYNIPQMCMDSWFSYWSTRLSHSLLSVHLSIFAFLQFKLILLSRHFVLRD